ncbi:hypothetical protein [Cytobacillus oceanisediminis]|uniref:hypothetical protein n=1 Tax=Cytobacillus oceanisediminis TaxID=665099 RepID=UPI00207AA46E|nr:hypothetical protein [Cytobacillus oceanisediminis]USK44661.1 hypothetical protein LIT27_01830 [Cytobacillus oceanisediminis]
MKKFLKGLFAASLVFVSFVVGAGTSFAADPSGWQLVDTYSLGNGTLAYLDGAEGGSAKICLKDAFGGANVTIYDNDGGSTSNSTVVKSTSFWGNGDCYSFNVEPYVDGSDNNAEFYVTTTRDIVGTIKFELWD